MNNAYLDVLSLRRPPLNYVTPAICDAVFSSTSFPTLILNALPVKTAITGLHIRFIGDTGDFELTWDNYPGAICYSVYKLNDANDPLGDYTIIAECITDIPFVPNDWDPDFDPDEDVCYLVTAITAAGETAISGPICNDEPPPLPPPPDGGGGCISNLTPLPDAESGVEYSVTFLPVGPAAGPLWTITGGVAPAGLTLAVGTGVFSGIPTVGGEFDFTVRLTKDGGGFCEKAFHMTVLADCFVNPSSLPQANFGDFYTEVLVPTSGLPGTIAVTAGAIPFGLSLHSVTGAFSGFPDDTNEVGTSLNFTVTFTPDDPFIEPCSQDFVLAVEYRCVAIEDLTWSINDFVPPALHHDPAQITVSMVDGDGSFAINRPLNGLGLKQCHLNSSQLWCLTPPFAPYVGGIEIDWNLVLGSSGGGSQSGISISTRLNGALLVPQLNRSAGPPGSSDSGTLVVNMGNLNPGTNYVITIEIDTGCTGNASVDFSGVIRVRPLVPP